MKKILLLSLIFALVLGTSCKKKETVLLSPKKEVKEISKKEFAESAVRTAYFRLSSQGDSVVVSANHWKLIGTDAKFAVIKLFKPKWNYDELKPILKDYPLTVVYRFSDGSQNLVYSYEEFVNLIKNDDGPFFVLEPRPKYMVFLGKEIYLVSVKTKIWNQR